MEDQACCVTGEVIVSIDHGMVKGIPDDLTATDEPQGEAE